MDIDLDILSACIPMNTKVEEGDTLGGDGLYYCGVCGKAKQYRIELFGKSKVVPCLCACGVARREAEEKARERKKFRQLVASLRSAGFAEDQLSRCTFENDNGNNPQLMDALKRYVANYDTFKAAGKGLLLYGNAGTGKTFAAACVANEIINAGQSAFMTSITRIVNTLQGLFEGRQEYLDKLDRFGLLIVDDLATERQTDFVREIIYQVIDNRYRTGRPLIVTTNMTLEEIKNPRNAMESRIFDRILERCHPLQVSGASQRRQKIIEDYERTKELLGL